MANNVFQVKRTTVSGRAPNTTGSYVTNSQYIAAGEFALNMADGILYSSNGSAVITVGSNLVNQNITGNLIVKAIIANGSIGTAGQVLTTNSTGVYWSTAGGGSGTVTSVATGNGMTGGPITTTGTVSILANTGIVANSTGTFVNASYIATITANNATFINGNSVLTVMESLRANRALHGGGTITVSASGDILWSARFIVISNGRGTHFSTEGFFNISCPTSGTITGVGGAANKTATAAGIPLGAWEALYYIMPIGSNSGSLAANFRVVSYTSDVEIPSDWLLICAQNGDNSNYYFNNGIILKASQSFAGGTFTSANMPQANNANNLGGTAAASYVQNTDSRTLSGNLVISGTSFTPSTNTILLGNSTQRWVLSANTGSFSGAVSGITTLAAGNTTLTGWASAQSVIITGGGSYTNGSIYSDANWGMLFRASRGSPTQAQYAWKSTDDVTEYLRISPTGNVGISNTSPNAKLQVTGTANISGDVIIGGSLTSGQFSSRRTDTQTAYSEVASIVQNYSATNTSILGFGQISNNRMYIEARDEINTKGTLSLQPYGGSVTVSGATTFFANVILGFSGLSANGGFGTAGQVLTTNGTAAYWTAAAGGGYYKGGSAAVGTLAVGGQNIFRVNANTLNNNTTIAAGENAQATGPIAVASGITLTVESGARVAIV